MADQVKVSFGDELKDGYKVTDNWTSNGIKWLEDIQTFYRERAQIEKEYSQKLQALSARYFEKKAKISTNLSVGDNPQITPGSLENASLVTWTEILNQTENIAKEKSRLSSELTLQVADQVHGIAMRFEDLRKRYSTYNEKMISERDSCYSDLKKGKANYDTACQAVENQRLKASKSYGSKDKAEKKKDQKAVEMNNSKNTYLIKINVANRLKDKYYHEDVPEMLDGMQQLNEARVAMLNSFWNQAIELEKASIKRVDGSLDAMTGIVQQNKPALDSVMFVKHNIAQWSEPKDFQYEPSPIWHEDESMITNDVALSYLRAKLTESRNKLIDQKAATEQRFEKYTEVVAQQKNTATVKPTAYLQLLSNHVNYLQELTTADSLRLQYQVEVETIEVAANGKDLSSLPAMEVKKRGLFGRKKTVKIGGDENNLTRSETRMSVASGASSGTQASVPVIGAGHHTGSFLSGLISRSRSKKAPTSNAPKVRAVYPYTATADDEITVLQDQELTLLEADDGSGWTKVQNPSGNSGLVPSSYVETIASSSETDARKKGPAVAPKRGAKKVKYMIAVYDYDAKGEDELTIRQGDKIAIVNEDDGNGWTEGELNAMSGVFPTAYAKSA